MIKVDGALVEFETFPNGETRVCPFDLVLGPSFVIVEFKYENDADLIKLMFVKRYLEEKTYLNIHLLIAYMPYSRQDRVEGKSVFTLKYITDFINSLKFTSVAINEPHSDVAPALLNRCTAEYPIGHIQNAMDASKFDRTNDYLLFPDAGAQKRYAGKFNGFKQLVGYKHRNFSTGKIDSMNVIGDIDSENFKVIIIDDLCSYGGTFVMATEQLKKLGASEVYLAVTHCEHSILKGKLLDSIDAVFTTNTIINPGVHQKINVEELV